MIEYSKKVLEHFKNPRNMGEIKNPDGVGKVGNLACLLSNEKIHTYEDIIEMCNLKINGKILDHNGEYSKIIKTPKRKYNGTIIKLKNKLGEVSMTPEHLIYAIKLPNGNKYFRNKNKKKLTAAWYHAIDLKKKDITLYPILKKEVDVKFIKINIPKLKYDFKSKELPKKVPVNNDFLRLAGYFLSEGSISDGKCSNLIAIHFNINEKEYAEDVSKISYKLFRIKPKIKERTENNTLNVYIHSARLARFFKALFNKGASNKRIPHFMIFLPYSKQKELIKGLWRGDGYINLKRNGPRAGYSTVSYYLAQQIKMLLLRQKIVPSIYTENEKIKNGVKHKKNYRIHVGQRNSLIKLASILGVKYIPKSYVSIKSWFDNDHLYTPITKIEKKGYFGYVYNLEVEKSHSFVSESFTLHNCGDVMYMYIKIGKNKENKKIIKDIKFKTLGCAAALATSSMITELAKGKTLEKAKKITRKDVADALGTLPPIKMHCSNLAADALHAAIKDYEEKTN